MPKIEVNILKHPMFLMLVGVKTYNCVLVMICVIGVPEINLMSGIFNYYAPFLNVTSPRF